jgi:hypothetical protein
MRLVDKVYNLLKDPKHLAKGSFAENADGHVVYPRDKSAVKWCVLGAVQKETKGQEETTYLLNQLDTIAQSLGYKSAVRLNDSADHNTVLRMLEIARTTTHTDSQ